MIMIMVMVMTMGNVWDVFHLHLCIFACHDVNDDNVTYFCGHNATFIDGLRPTLEAPSTSWSEWMPTGVHSSDTGIRDEMR